MKKMVELQVENVEEWTWEYSNVFPFSALLFKLLAKEDFVCFSELRGNNGKVKDIEGRESEGEREREKGGGKGESFTFEPAPITKKL